MTSARTLLRTSNSNAVAWKAQRIAAGGEIRAMDLFSGCGGLSLGFYREGFSISANLELDENAARSHALNFHGPEGSDGFKLHAQARDITKTHPLDIARELGMGDMERAVDVIIGGPPCQAYSRVGRAKLLNLAASYEAYLGDSRRTLYQNYLTYVEAFKPLALLMENVPDILNQSGDNIMEGIAVNLGELGYDVRYTILNSAFYGVPQTRDRAFLMAFRREMGVVPSFPEPTCHFVLPHGYHIARKHTMRHVTVGKDSAFVMPENKNDDSDKLTCAVTAEDALADLPFMEGVVHDSPKTVKQKNGLPYRDTDILSDYATLMRSWKGFEANETVVDNHIRRLPRDTPIFREMREGAEYPEAWRMATKLFEERVIKEGLQNDTSEWIALKALMVPPYNPKKFSNRWWKLRRNAPVRTLLAHLGKDCYTHIHYDSAQGRTISVREAARLQSFPDGFRFSGSMGVCFKQIGNAVPPLLAAAVANQMHTLLMKAVNHPG